MLTITVPLSEGFDEETGKFVITEGYDLDLEHSLVSLSKWESHFEKPFLGKEEKTVEETLYYIQHCMVLTKNPPEEIFQRITQKNFDDIQNYISAKRSATWFNDQQNRPGPQRQIITSAVIYGWMVGLRIPFEAQYWHLNELFTLIRVCNEQMKTPKKMGRGEAARQQAALNAQRKAQMGTRG